MAEPLRFGRQFLAGDAAHVVPPTGAKGLNLALSDVAILVDALVEAVLHNSTAEIDGYSAKVLQRVWKLVRFSWWLTSLMHFFPETQPFDNRLQQAEFDALAGSTSTQRSFADPYTGV